MFKELEKLNALRKLGYELKENNKSDRAITHTFVDRDTEEEFEVVVYRADHEIDYQFDMGMYVKDDLMRALVDVDWKQIDL